MSFPSPSTLILDFGGVLTSDLWVSIRACARREGLPDDTLLKLMREDPEIHGKFILLEQGGISQHDFETALADAANISPDRLLERMCADLRPDHAMLDAVADLRSVGVRIGILSNSWGSGYFSPYRGYNLENRADTIVYSDRVGLRKPQPAIFELILGRLQAQARDSMFVDDMESNLAAAHTLGMKTIHHTRTTETISAFEKAFDINLNQRSGRKS